MLKLWGLLEVKSGEKKRWRCIIETYSPDGCVEGKDLLDQVR